MVLKTKGTRLAVERIDALLTERLDSFTKAKFVANDSPVLPRLATVVLLGASGCCLSALFYFVFHYGWTGERQFTTRFGPLIYYAAPAILALLLALSTKLKPGFRVSLAVSFLLFGASLYGSEIFWQLSPRKVTMQAMLDAPSGQRREIADQLAREFGVEIDSRKRQQVVDDLRRKGIDAMPQLVLPPVIHVGPGFEPEININGSPLMPLGGKANTVSVVCNQTGEYLTYKSDEHGFYNPPGQWRPGELDIVATGNSGTNGLLRAERQEFCRTHPQARPRLLNLGMSGAGPLQQLAALKEYGATLKPATVLWFYAEGTGLHEIQIEKHSRMFLRYLEPGFNQDLIHRQPDVDQAVRLYVAKQNTLDAGRGRPGRWVGGCTTRHWKSSS